MKGEEALRSEDAEPRGEAGECSDEGTQDEADEDKNEPRAALTSGEAVSIRRKPGRSEVECGAVRNFALLRATLSSAEEAAEAPLSRDITGGTGFLRVEVLDALGFLRVRSFSAALRASSRSHRR